MIMLLLGIQLFLPISVIWSLSGLGDPECSDSCSERLKVTTIFALFLPISHIHNIDATKSVSISNIKHQIISFECIAHNAVEGGMLFDQVNLCRYVGMSVYNVTIMCVLGVAISAVLNEHPNASFVLISVFIIFCTTGTLCLVFVPKVFLALLFSHLIVLFPSPLLASFLREI